MMLAQPTPAEELEGVVLPPSLGRLGAPLLHLARAQGAWPPTFPSLVAAEPPVSSWEEGLAAADRLVDEGTGLVVVRGGGPRGPALALLAVLLHLEPVVAVGTSSTPGWASLVAEVRDGLRASRPHLGDAEVLVQTLSAEPVAGLAGLIARSAERRTPVLISSAPDAIAAAVLAERVGPGSSAWVLAGCSAAAGGGVTGLTELGLTPLLDLRLPGPEGADLAVDLLRSAVGLARG